MRSGLDRFLRCPGRKKSLFEGHSVERQTEEYEQRSACRSLNAVGRNIRKSRRPVAVDNDCRKIISAYAEKRPGYQSRYIPFGYDICVVFRESYDGQRRRVSARSFFTDRKLSTLAEGVSGRKNRTTIQFVDKEKRLQKGVDKGAGQWYYNKAVARQGKRKDLKNRMRREFPGQEGLE